MAGAITFTYLILLSTVLIQNNYVDANPLTFIKPAFKFAWMIYQNREKVGEFFGILPEVNGSYDKSHIRVMNQLNDLSNEIQNVQHVLLTQIMNLPDKTTTTTDKLMEKIGELNPSYERFLELTTNPEIYNEDDLWEFAEPLVSHSSMKLREIISAVHEALVNKNILGQNIPNLLSEKNNIDLMCRKGKTMQQIIFNIFQTVVNTHTKAFSLLMFSLDMKDKRGLMKNKDVIFPREYRLFEKKMNETFIKIRHALTVAPRELYRCEPKNHIKNTTYSRLEEIFQRFIHHERDEVTYNKQLNSRKCGGSCARFDDKDKFYAYCHSNFCRDMPTKRRCTGHFRDCDDYSNDGNGAKTSLCKSAAGDSRRYEWMEFQGNRYGRDHRCDGSMGERMFNVTNDNDQGYGNVCSYCSCTCVVDDRDMDRYFSLEPVIAERCKNMVITGIRFEKKGHVFYIQIKQGVLGANATVDNSTTEWKEINETPINLDLFTNVTRGYKQSENDPFSLTNNTIYYANPYVFPVTYDQRTVYLDEIEPKAEDEGQHTAATGVRFVQMRDALRLQIQMTPFDYETGKLLDNGKWWPKLDDGRKRRQLELKHADMPTSKMHHEIDSTTNQYIKFQMTDDRKDFGQTIVPFLDMQEIETEPPMPLAGVSLVHKGAKDSGGFLAFKLIQYNFAKHLTDISVLLH